MGWRHHCTKEDPAFGQGENQFSLCVEQGRDHLRGCGVHRQSRKQLCCPSRDEARKAEQQDPEGSNLQSSLVDATAEVTSPGSSPGIFSAARPCSVLTSWVWAALCTGGEIWDTQNILGCVKHFLDQTEKVLYTNDFHRLRELNLIPDCCTWRTFTLQRG